jgi:hypothetical protein
MLVGCSSFADLTNSLSTNPKPICSISQSSSLILHAHYIQLTTLSLNPILNMLILHAHYIQLTTLALNPILIMLILHAHYIQLAGHAADCAGRAASAGFAAG